MSSDPNATEPNADTWGGRSTSQPDTSEVPGKAPLQPGNPNEN